METFSARLGEAAFDFGIEIHAYCVMGTHYHLLARGPELELRRAAAAIEADVEHDTEPTRFRMLVAGRHLLQVSCYIHRNPVVAGLVEHPAHWPWSSYRGYLDPLDGPEWLRSRHVLGWLGSFGPRLRYRQLVENDRGR